MKCGVPPEAVMRTPGRNMFFIYIIQSERTNKYYVGYSSNIERRLDKHNAGDVLSTKHGIPWRLIYQETFTNKKAVM